MPKEHPVTEKPQSRPRTRSSAASAHTFVDPYLVALIYLSLKDADNTYAWLDKAYADRSSFLISIATDPKWAASRHDARFQDLLDRMTAHAGQ